MSTPTMMSNHSRRFVTPIDMGPPNKRPLDGSNSPPFKKQTRPINPKASSMDINPSAQNNHLLAGYLAHEFLTKGTLFGERWDPARAEAVPVSADSRREKDSRERKGRVGPSKGKYESYVAVADLLKTDGVRLSGVVNPTQLACYLQM